MKTGLLLSFVSLYFLCSCVRTIPCLTPPITPAFIGFRVQDLDTLIVKEYKSDGTFTTLLDSATIVQDTNFLKLGLFHDTAVVELNLISGQSNYLQPDHDWQIFVPATNRTISFSNFAIIYMEGVKCSFPSDYCSGCENPVDSVRQDGQNVRIEQHLRTVGSPFLDYVTYIH